MGHMNVQFYATKVNDAFYHLRAAIGITPETLRGNRASMVPLVDDIRYLRELRSTDLLEIHSAIVDVRDRTMQVRHEIFNTTTGDLSCTFDTITGNFDQQTRHLKPWPEAIKAQAQELIIPPPRNRHPPMPGLDASIRADLETANRLSLPETFRGAVNSWEVDQMGHMNAQYYLNFYFQAGSHLMHRVGMTIADLRKDNLGSAVLNYIISYRKELRDGDIVLARSGIAAVNDKTYRLFHWLFNAESGELCSTLEALVIMFDMEQRKALPMPPRYQERFRQHLCPWSSM